MAVYDGSWIYLVRGSMLDISSEAAVYGNCWMYLVNGSKSNVSHRYSGRQ